MIGPHALHQRRAKRSRRIHARPCQTDRAQMSERHRQADRKRRNEPVVWLVLVAHTKHAEHQQEAEEELNAQSLGWQHTIGQLRVANVGELVGQQGVQGGRAGHGAAALD